MGDKRLVIVGAGLAGLRAAEAARKAGHIGPVVLLGEELHLPYDRPPLSKEFLEEAEVSKPDPHLREESFLRQDLELEVRTGEAVTGLDLDARQLETSCGRVGYDALIVATGAAARRLPGTDHLTGVLALRTLDDARSLRLALDAGARTVVVGAGFIGSEVASSARKRGLDVTVIEALAAPLVRSLGVEVGAMCSELHELNGTDLRLSTGVVALHPRADSGTSGQPAVGSVELSDGTRIDADVVVVGIGAVPSTAWLEGSGVALHERDRGVLCDDSMQALDADGRPIDSIWAAGDVAHWRNELFGRLMRLEHWTSAAEQGAVAARNAVALEGERRTYSTVPYFWSDWYGTRLQFVGVPDSDEVLVQRRTDQHGGSVVLYRSGDRIIGALTIGRPDLVMKYRRLVSLSASWSEGVAFGAAAS